MATPPVAKPSTESANPRAKVGPQGPLGLFLSFQASVD